MNIHKHKVTFTEVVESFFDPHGFQLIDEKPSKSAVHES